MDEETIIYYEPDPVVSAIYDMKIVLHEDIKANTELLDELHQYYSFGIVSDLWVVLLLGFLIGIGLVIIFKRK
ncbi:MAG: hypothetical protein ACI4J0_06290 [Huintestinicola sp.]|uniref:hypothetical protein n=1 Tax=Huintestinicola sp. TaxID=2981661 RepID=UPI003EFDDFA6